MDQLNGSNCTDDLGLEGRNYSRPQVTEITFAGTSLVTESYVLGNNRTYTTTTTPTNNGVDLANLFFNPSGRHQFTNPPQVIVVYRRIQLL